MQVSQAKLQIRTLSQITQHTQSGPVGQRHPSLPSFPHTSARVSYSDHGPVLLLTRQLPKQKDDQITVKPLEITNMSYNSAKAWRA